jgi:hypothetical protein
MITNINYLKTALECLEEGQTPMTELKILKTIQQICEMNINRIETNLVDKVEDRLYNTNTEKQGATNA